VTYKLARTLLFTTLACLLVTLPGSPFVANVGADPAPAGRVVYLAHELSDEQQIVLGATLAGCSKPATLLLDSPATARYLKPFLDAYKPDAVLRIGAFADENDLNRRLGVSTAPLAAWNKPQPFELWQESYPKPATVVICPPQPRGQLLQAACFAGTLQAPLFVFHGQSGETTQLHKRLTEWGTKQVYLVGEMRNLAHTLPPMQVHKLADEDAVATAHVKHLARQGRIETLVIANPYDYLDNPQPMSPLAPWIALQKHAPLLLTNEGGHNVEELVQTALRQESLKKVENIIYVADLNAIPLLRRPNPIETDKDELIEMEPLTPTRRQPFTFAIGRLFHDDPAVVPLVLARQQLLANALGPRKALVMSNPGNSLPLLETFSRNTAKELANVGYDTTGRFRQDVDGEELRKLICETDVFLWEGHHSTLVREYGLPNWNEPMRPALVFLQSCLALKETKVQPLLSRGAVAVVGSSTRTYSGSGGACSLAFFNALAYDDLTLGASLRQSKNFLLAYSLLKEKRLGEAAKRGGANQRSAWAFTLWGDPTLKLPRPTKPANALPHIRSETAGNIITITLPEEPHAKVKSTKYQVEMMPNARLAGLLHKEKLEDGQPMVPFIFAEVQLPKARAGCEPKLHSKIASSRWVFVYDERRNMGYILITSNPADEKELRFHVEWQPVESASNAQPMTTGSGE
jgi:hypothetical protein